jgi:hypothetical protein
MDVDKSSELFNGDYNYIFHDIQFENLYQGKLFWNTIMLNHYKELDNSALQIMNQTKKNNESTTTYNDSHPLGLTRFIKLNFLHPFK